MNNLANRRPSEQFELACGLTLSVGYDPRSGYPCEIFFVGRGRSGTEIDDRLIQAGIAASKAIQKKL